MFTIKDFSNALYALSKSKSYAATIVVTLAVTLGTLIAAFNLNYTIVAAPLPYQDEDRLVVGNTPWYEHNELFIDEDSTIQLLIEFYLQDSTTFENTALIGYSWIATSLRDKDDTPKVLIAYTTPGYMQMYQMPMILGRGFNTDEDIHSHAAVAVISERVWRQHYNADPEIVGKSIQISDTQFQVIGVASSDFVEPRFTGPNRHNDVWLPWDFNPDPCASGLYGRACFVGWHFLLAKLKSADDHQRISQQLTASLNAEFQDAIAGVPGAINHSIRFEARPLRQVLLRDSAAQTFWLFIGSLVLLCIACVNTLNLVLSRAVRQQRSMAIKAALGAQRKHIFIHVFSEMLLLLGVAVLIALVIAQAEYRLLQHVAEAYLPRVTELQLNLPTLVFSIAITVFIGLSFAYLVVRQINYRALNSELQSSGKGSGLQISVRVRHLLIISQVALTSVLLVACVLVLQQTLSVLKQDIGFATERIYQIDIDEVGPAITAETRPERHLEKKRDLSDIRELLAQHPAVKAASYANYAPANFDGVFSTTRWPRTPDNIEDIVISRLTITDQHFLPLFEIKLLSGRNFSAQEVVDSSPVIIVNESFAKAAWPDQQAVGQRLGMAQNWEVIGVVADYNLIDQYSPTEPPRAFIPRNINDVGGTLLYELKPGMSISKTELNHIMAQVSPKYRAAEIFSLEQNVKRILFANYLAAGVTSVLSLLTLLLAAVGIYGVLSYNAQLRKFELGVRMAIGARPLTILTQSLRENIKLVFIGLLCSLVLLAILWLFINNSTFTLSLSLSGVLVPFASIMLLTGAVSLLSIWSLIRQPAINALRN
ncbi:ABC transporter permease [Alkalimonas amylolytica]|uniref:Duplicated orphan permease n=1 Tax=Alkalimonas amylolytica TaxID=152573 RepID=A0A1H4G7Q2_ALKAM|nr:ABC transporter permease [Alkalimonas amylolytica]SEB04928.1 duplicated orphan permease [Alkalimonas amylolytica]